jgi:isopropylmalate/homocitrate/citramalate synthase
MEALGIDSLDLGLPGAGPRAVEHVTALAREIVAHKMKIRANCAARTHENDIRPIAEIVQKTGLRIEAATFIGSSPIRRFTEGWSDDFLLQTTEKAVKYAVSLGLDSMYVTEDTKPLRSGDGEAVVFDGDQLRRAGDRDLRHRGARYAHGCVRWCGL